MARRFRPEYVASRPLIPGEHVTGVVHLYSARSGRLQRSSTWEGTYVGTQEPDPTDPWLNADGTPAKDQGETVHLFRDGHLGGTPQGNFGFPVALTRTAVVAEGAAPQPRPPGRSSPPSSAAPSSARCTGPGPSGCTPSPS